MASDRDFYPAESFSFTALIDSIHQAHRQLSEQASMSVNVCLTVRNWLIGYYIAEYELHGKDRATYGQGLIDQLSKQLGESLDHCYTSRYVRLCKQFYETYPQIRKSLISESEHLIIGKSAISRLPITVAEEVSLSRKISASPEDILSRLSFTHIVELLKCEDDTKRTFYELECIRSGWSVRELKRQIASLYYERTGLSTHKGTLSKQANQNSEQDMPGLTIRDPYVFEFLGLRPAEVMSESHLEDELLRRLEGFLLELGHGFCFEARQKRILIGGEHFFVDLVFYHRVLKCHVLVELKLDSFSHENLGQLNTYVNWYRRHMMSEGDQPPVGILLCSQKNQSLVEYALAGMDNQLFVSKYQVELPSKQTMQAFIDAHLREQAAPDAEKTSREDVFE